MIKFATNILLIFFLSGSTLFLLSCKKENGSTTIAIDISEKIKIDSSQKYKESFRPQFHFSPKKKWMNDMNVMVFYKGIYHLLYQYYPDDIVWGPIHWTNKKIVLFPDTVAMIFSGSAVVNLNNTFGLGTTENPPIIAI